MNLLRLNNKFLYIALFVAAALGGTAGSSWATQFNVGGRPMNLLGYITQAVQVSAYDKEFYDTEHGFNSAIFNFFMEGDYSFTPDLKIFASGMFTVDWIYQMKSHDNSWNDKLFDKSKNNLNVDDHYWQLLKEVHFTWAPENWFFRAGKQVVVWGEMRGVRIMDQINPLDQRRGMADVEFESTIIPIWLVRAEHYLTRIPTWIQDLGIEFIFNPNADFIPDQSILPGNDEGGIWAPRVMIPNEFPQNFFFYDLPADVRGNPLRLGSYASLNLEEPDNWNSDGYEYGLRIKMLIRDAFITLNYWYGYDNVPVIATSSPGFMPNFIMPGRNVSVASNRDILFHPTAEGFYPLQRFVGFTVAKDFEWMNLKWLGGVAPMWRFEAFYNFNKKYATAVDSSALNNLTDMNGKTWTPADAYHECDEIRYAISCDWKVKIRPLNEKFYFTLGPMFYHRHIRDYPRQYVGQGTYGLKEGSDMYLENDNYVYVLFMMTQYYHGKILPTFFIAHDQTWRAQMIRLQVDYDRSHLWRYSVGGIFMNGSEVGGFNIFENKDYVFFKISYRWG